MPDRPLTTKQVKWKEAFLRGLPGIDCSRFAEYKGNANVLSQVAYRNIRNSKIKTAIDEDRAKLRQESKNEIEQLIDAWQDLRTRCKDKDNSTEARCLENISKHYGFYALDNEQKTEIRQLIAEDVVIAKAQAAFYILQSLNKPLLVASHEAENGPEPAQDGQTHEDSKEYP